MGLDFVQCKGKPLIEQLPSWSRHSVNICWKNNLIIGKPSPMSLKASFQTLFPSLPLSNLYRLYPFAECVTSLQSLSRKCCVAVHPSAHLVRALGSLGYLLLSEICLQTQQPLKPSTLLCLTKHPAAVLLAHCWIFLTIKPKWMESMLVPSSQGTIYSYIASLIPDSVHSYLHALPLNSPATNILTLAYG